jgi:hypothetical protein
MPGDVQSFVSNKAIDAAQKVGLMTPQQAERTRQGEPEFRKRASAVLAPVFPTLGQLRTSDEIRDALPRQVQEAGAYKPKTVVGEYARTIGEFAPNALTPGGVPLKFAAVAVPALASETAGQVTKGTRWETPARIAGGMVGVGRMHGIAAPTTGRVFWSGGDEIVKPAAASFARANHGVTLEQTIPGRALAKTYDLIEQKFSTDIARKVMTRPFKLASLSFAQGAEGPLDVFLGTRLRPSNIWETVERPVILPKNRITEHRIRN